ncbi:MAG: bifunctional UDP-N-acetylmuramoyl-tripeptide:D-alanyl-D-alanine ligase/alanine racemase [Saprospiraceae bacterium]|nr:bifunctional UDP-N-acetylmuramoyl-tripeptide:D-alanyl-D-alanine ligase/alanine racemase [Saprospiraceae bacterium]
MFKTKEISDIVGAATRDTTGTEIISHVSIDSRLVEHPETTLFVCLTGSRHDGHDFIPSLYDKGVRHFIVDHSYDSDPPVKAQFYRVENSVIALQKLAAAHRKNISARVIGVTGSNGKTIVKEWLSQLLSRKYNVYRSPGSYNSQIGVALSVLGIPDHADLAVIEAGISQEGEMTRLEKMIRPDLGIFTNIGDAHAAGFTNLQDKFDEKSLLFKNATWWTGHDLSKYNPDKNYRPWSTLKTNGVHVQWSGQSIAFEGYRFDNPFSDRASMENLTHCLVFCHHFDPHLLEELQADIDQLQTVSMRTELRKGVRNCSVISDYYNLDIESLSNVLDLANQINRHLKKIIVISDFVDNRNDKALYLKAIRRIEKAGIDTVLVIGKDWKEHLDEMRVRDLEVFHFPDVSTLLVSRQLKTIRNSLIILKGARRFQFEKIEKKLVRPVYGTRLEIDLAALRHNWLALTRRLDPGVKRLVMVKASAYGSGSDELARFYEDNKVDYLGVAYANEAVGLREKGISVPILVMNAEPASFPLIDDYNLEPEIHGLTQLRGFLDEMGPEDRLTIHLKCETGMHRLGFEAQELDDLFDMLKDEPRIKVASVFSHLSSADDPDSDEYTKAQIAAFNGLYDQIASALGYSPIKHIANSAGLIRFAEAHFDMVRMGIALYGCGAAAAFAKDLTPVHALRSYIIQVKERHKGDRIGYGMEGKVERVSKIATLPIGYGDGLPRLLGNGRLKVFVNDHFAPSIGRICMDMTMIDVTEIPNIEIYQEVEIFGEKISLDNFAAMAGTIPYEILVSLGNRIERVITKA